MKVPLQDAQEKLHSEHGIDIPFGTISELVYADDALLVGESGQVIQTYLQCIVAVRNMAWS